MLRSYFHKLLARYLSLSIRPGDSMVDIDPDTEYLSERFPQRRATTCEEMVRTAEGGTGFIDADYIFLGGMLHYERDILTVLGRIRPVVRPQSRLVLTYYSSLWRPAMQVASALGLRERTPEINWLAHGDVANLLHLSDFEVVRIEGRVICPVYIPLVSAFLNRYLAPLPLFRQFALVNILVARPILDAAGSRPPSVSVVVAARNEQGNIAELVRRLPAMGPDDELIFVEGGSKDATWEAILASQREWHGRMRIVAAKQEGKGKGDAVRKGFSLATREILMILDADMTVPPEDLPKFYRAIASGKGEFINGSRLVYPMEKRAMRFINLLGNKFFAAAFSYVLGQRFKDTLCGTKVLTRSNYDRLAANRSYFGEFDPFGDFDLIFGAARMGLRIVEVPISYRERTYGETNISRWRHGALLIAMLVFAARRLKFI